MSELESIAFFAQEISKRDRRIASLEERYLFVRGREDGWKLRCADAELEVDKLKEQVELLTYDIANLEREVDRLKAELKSVNYSCELKIKYFAEWHTKYSQENSELRHKIAQMQRHIDAASEKICDAYEAGMSNE